MLMTMTMTFMIEILRHKFVYDIALYKIRKKYIHFFCNTFLHTRQGKQLTDFLKDDNFYCQRAYRYGNRYGNCSEPRISKIQLKIIQFKKWEDISARLTSISLEHELGDNETEKVAVNVKSSGCERTVFHAHTEGVTITSAKGSMKDTENNKKANSPDTRKEEPAFINLETSLPLNLPNSPPPYKCYTTHFRCPVFQKQTGKVFQFS